VRVYNPSGGPGWCNDVEMSACAPSATFRLPLTSLVGVFTLAVGATPLAFAAPGLQALYVVPAGLAVWLLRTRTVAGADTLVAHRLLRSRRVAWADVARLRVQERSWVRVVLCSGEEVTLPAVRARDLPLLAAVSGGRIDDPTAAPERPALE
jgi:PH (Pleckstrin Homology) domain-containing protein